MGGRSENLLSFSKMACAPSQVNINNQRLRKLSNFNFSRQTPCTRIIISIILHSFLHLLRAIKCNKLDEITPKKRLLWDPEETNFKNFKFHQMNLMYNDFTCVFSIPVKFGIH